MDRATKDIETPNGVKVVINQWLTGREHEYIQEPMLKGVSVNTSIESGRPEAEMKGFDISFMTESTHRTIEKMVVSVDGSTDDVLNRVLDLRKEDYEAVVKAINETTAKKE